MRQKDDSKAQDILIATLDEVEAVGLAGLSIEAVARRAGVASGTIYTYFRNKEALLDALYRHTKARFMAFVPRDEGLPVRAAFSAMVAAFIDYLIANNRELVFMGQMVNSPYLTDDTRMTVALGTRPLTALLERGKAEHLLKDMDTAWMLAFLNGAVRDMTNLAAGMSEAERTAYKIQVATLCWDALKA